MDSLEGHLERCAINTATLGHREPLDKVIDRIARQGFGGLAPWRSEVEAAGVSNIAKQIRRLDLQVTGYCRSTYLPAATAAERTANIHSNIAALHDAAELGAVCFVMVVGGIPPQSGDSRDTRYSRSTLDGAREQVKDALHVLLETARAVNVPLALEPLHPMYAANRSVVNTIGQALDICREVEPEGMRHLGVAVDVYHCWWDPLLQASIQAAGEAGRILAYHVSDWLHETSDMLLDRGMMGDGVIDLQGIRQCVERAQFKGLVEVEIFSRDHWWRQTPDEVLRVCAERLQAVC